MNNYITLQSSSVADRYTEGKEMVWRFTVLTTSGRIRKIVQILCRTDRKQWREEVDAAAFWHRLVETQP